MITAAQLRKVMPLAGANADIFAPLLSESADRFGVDTPLRRAAFVATIAEETGELNRLVESFNYKDPARLYKIFPNDFKSLKDAVAVHARGHEAIANRVYANQNGNGNEASGDGWKYRGRSCIQITGKENYIGVMLALNLDLVAQPELLEVPAHAADAAGFYWQAHRVNEPADAGDMVTVTKRVNGGRNGIDERINYYRRAVEAFCK